jgi:hypothetical protein
MTNAGQLVLEARCRDALLEHDPGYLTDDLLEIARLVRDRDHAQAVLGPDCYRRALAFSTRGLQIVQGRLLPVLYALVQPVP